MRIDPMPIVVGVAAGAIDEVLIWQDEKNARTGSFKTWSDYGRIALTILGYAGTYFNFLPNLAAPLAQSEITLLTKSISTYFRSAITPAAAAAPRTAASWSRKVAQTPGPGFKGAETF